MSEYALADEHFEKALQNVQFYGNRPDLRADVRISKARVAYLNGDLGESIKQLHQSRKLVGLSLSTVLPGLPPADQQRYLQIDYANGFHQALSVGLCLKDNPRAAICSADWLVNGKALSQEVAAESALLAAPETAPFVQQLRTVRGQISRLWTQDPEMKRASNQERLAELEAEEKSIQQEINQRGPKSELGKAWVTTGELMSKIEEDSVIINFAKFRVADLSNSGPEYKWQDSKYVAWIIPPAGLGNVQIVDLGNADAIEPLVGEFLKQVEAEGKARSSLGGFDDIDETKSRAKFEHASKKLSEKLIAPLEPFLKNVKQLHLSPDGELWKIPWDALLTQDGKFLIESFRTTYTVSGRELAFNTSRDKSKTGKPAIFANPNFNLGAEKIKRVQKQGGTRSRAVTSAYFSELEGTAKEAKWIRPGIEKYTDQECQMCVWDEAQEATFKQLHRPRVLVLSTHGYYTKLKDESVTKYSLQNPLIRCGLALAGANNRNAAATLGNDDGILTGLEIIGTDLRGTELVVLSACQTGTGELNDGEGVSGLRQAFQLAGAKSVVASLWNVADEETANLMKRFFEELSTGTPKPIAFRDAQLSRIKSLREQRGYASPYLWAAFTYTGKP